MLNPAIVYQMRVEATQKDDNALAILCDEWLALQLERYKDTIGIEIKALRECKRKLDIIYAR